MSQLERSMLAKMMVEIAKGAFPHSTVGFYPYPSVGMHGKEPGEAVADKMCRADVVIAIANYSLSHSNAREEATKAGVRIASMPDFLARMFHPDGPMAVDYHQVAADSERLAELITAVDSYRRGSPLQKYVADGVITKWAVPENCPFVEELPRTSVDKIDKKALRGRCLPLLDADFERTR